MVRFGREESPCTFAPAFERGSDDKDEMLEERTARIAEELKEEFFLVIKQEGVDTFKCKIRRREA